MRVHKRLLDIVDHTAKTVDSLQRLDLPAAWTSRSRFAKSDSAGPARLCARGPGGVRLIAPQSSLG